MKSFKIFMNEQETTVDCVSLVSKLGSASRQIKDLHWNVNGDGFLPIHELYGELYDSLVGFQDRIAEYSRGTGKFVTGQTSDIKVLSYSVNGSINETINIVSSLRDSVAVVEHNSDDASAKNILGELAEELDKYSYKLKSILGAV